MAYASWSVVFGEQPSAAKWNILGTNDASFNDGTGITALDTSVTAISNPYKFYAYRNAAWTTNGSGAIVPYDTKLFDTNNNFDITTNVGRYTAPVDGFYQFSARADSSHTGTSDTNMRLFVNGSSALYGDRFASSISFLYSGTVNGMLQLSAGDYVEAYYDGSGTAGGTGADRVYFSGFLVSET